MNHHEIYGDTEGPLGFPCPSNIAKNLDILLKTLPKGKEYEYKKAMTQGQPQLVPGERADISWISTEVVDREGHVVIAKGMNDSQYLLNPVVTICHNYWTPPVGRSVWRKAGKNSDGTRGIQAKTHYPEAPASWPTEKPWKPDEVFAQIQTGLCNGKSIGFLPLKVHYADPKAAKANNWPDGTLVIDEWLLLEYACAYFPTNQEATVTEVSKATDIAFTGEQEICGMIARAFNPQLINDGISSAIATTFGRV